MDDFSPAMMYGRIPVGTPIWWSSRSGHDWNRSRWTASGAAYQYRSRPCFSMFGRETRSCIGSGRAILERPFRGRTHTAVVYDEVQPAWEE